MDQKLQELETLLDKFELESAKKKKLSERIVKKAIEIYKETKCLDTVFEILKSTLSEIEFDDHDLYFIFSKMGAYFYSLDLQAEADGDEKHFERFFPAHVTDYFSDIFNKLSLNGIYDQVNRINSAMSVFNRDEDKYFFDALQDMKDNLTLLTAIEEINLGIFNNQHSPESSPVQNKEKEERVETKKILNSRQSVMLFLTLMYGKPNVPNRITKRTVELFIRSFKSLDTSNIYKYVTNSIRARKESIKDRASRVRDIEIVVQTLKELGINEQRWIGIVETKRRLETEINEIEFWKKEDQEEKQKFR